MEGFVSLTFGFLLSDWYRIFENKPTGIFRFLKTETKTIYNEDDSINANCLKNYIKNPKWDRYEVEEFLWDHDFQSHWKKETKLLQQAFNATCKALKLKKIDDNWISLTGKRLKPFKLSVFQNTDDGLDFAILGVRLCDFLTGIYHEQTFLTLNSSPINLDGQEIKIAKREIVKSIPCFKYANLYCFRHEGYDE